MVPFPIIYTLGTKLGMRQINWLPVRKASRQRYCVQDTLRHGEDFVDLFETAPRSFRKKVVDDRNHESVQAGKDDKVSPPQSSEGNGRDLRDQHVEGPEHAHADAIDGGAQIQRRHLGRIKKRNSTKSQGMTEVEEEGEEDGAVHGQAVMGLRAQSGNESHGDTTA